MIMNDNADVRRLCFLSFRYLNEIVLVSQTFYDDGKKFTKSAPGYVDMSGEL